MNNNIEEFDWSLYESGYAGGNKLVINKSVKAKGKDKVYSHEHYAQELYDMYNKKVGSVSSKDDRIGTIYKVTEIVPVSDHEIRIDTDNGMSSIIDLNKERQFIETIGFNKVSDFLKVLFVNPEFKKSIIDADVRAKVVENKRVSLWEGNRAKIESEFMEQLRSPYGPTCAYKCHIMNINNGGFTVDVMGLSCFLPGSLAAAGPITDFESYIGKDLLVCVVNYSPSTKNFVVSYKKYLEITLPSMIENNLSVGMEMSVKVTGVSKNGLFCIMKNSDGDYVYPSLLHRSEMSPEFEKDFNERFYSIGDQFKAYIHKINFIDGNYRIVIGDKPYVENEESEEEQ